MVVDVENIQNIHIIICYCTIDYWGGACQFKAREVQQRELPPKLRQFLTYKQPQVKEIVRNDKYDALNTNRFSRTVMTVINRFKIPKTHKDHLDMSDKMKRHFINFVLREANRRGKVIHSTTAIEVTFRNKWNRGEIGRRLLTLAEGEEYTDVEMSFTFNSTDDDELAEFAEAFDEPIDTLELANEINNDTEFLDELYDGQQIDPTDVEEYTTDNDFNITVIDYIDIDDDDVYSTFESLDDVEQYRYTETPPNNANDPEGNGYEPTTKARIIGTIRRRKSPYTGDAKSVDEVKNIIRDLLSNPRRQQWPIAKK